MIKRNALSALLCVCLLLGGCNNNTGETGTGAQTAPPVVTTAEETAPAETTALPRADETLSLANLPLGKLSDTYLTYMEFYLKEYFAPRGTRLGDFKVSYGGESSVKIENSLFVRETTKKIAVTDEEKNDFRRETYALSYATLEQAAESSAYLSFRQAQTYLDIEELKTAAEPSNLTANAVNAQCGYRLEDYFSTNAFVAQDENGEIRFIIDPAYMIGIPVIAKNPAHLTFDLNGMDVMMDSFPVASEYENAASFPEVFENRGTDFFYARIRIGGLSVNYDFKTGYHCTASVTEIEPLTDDIELALIQAFVADDPDKDPEMSAVYHAIVENLDVFYKDTTHGIVLLDLDFDGTPELLVSDVYRIGEQDSSDELGVNVSVYRIGDGELKYIDSFQNAHRVVYAVWNSLGKKTLPGGTVGWFSTSPDDEDFLYRLEGDRLVATPIFQRRIVSEMTNEYGNTTYGYEYYYMGERIVPTVTHSELAEDEYGSDTHYEWNGSYSYWGEMWELYGMAREDYCADISETYSLYSDFLTTLAGNHKYDDPIKLTKRELCYNLAYMTDCYFLGSYDPAKRRYTYEFLGAYAKPVIYLYPEEETEVSVRVDFTEGGELTCTYPDYGEGWEVTARPDGTILDKDGNEYYCLYWEGEGNARFEKGKGWCVSREDTASFLREKLTEIGLTAREANEFIIYWLPELQKNPYNLIAFHTDDYARSVPLTVSPAPDTVIRVFMTYEPCDEPTEIEPQSLPRYERNGFTVVEWGGSHA